MTRALAPDLVEARLREASRLSDLSASTRLHAKLDLSPEGVRRRLMEASDLLDACNALAALGRASDRVLE